MRSYQPLSIGNYLLQFCNGYDTAQARSDHYAQTHVHIKTNITKAGDIMMNFNIRGYSYAPVNIDTDVAFYCYAPVSFVYGVSVNHKAWSGFNVGMYYSSDNYVCIKVDGLGAYGGFVLNFINTSLIPWSGVVGILAWTKANTGDAQY